MKFKYRVHKLMGIAIYIEGERVTGWHDTYAAATNELREQVSNLA